MFARMLIRKKILFSTVLLTVTLLLLMYCSLRGVYAYRDLTLMVKQLATELETTSVLRIELDKLLKLSRKTSDMSNALAKLAASELHHPPPNQRKDFRDQLHEVDVRLDDYERQLASYDESDHLLADRDRERKCVAEIRKKLVQVKFWCAADNPDFFKASAAPLEDDIQSLVEEVQRLPTFVLERMKSFRGVVRSRYRTLIFMIAASSLTALAIVGVSFRFFRSSVVQPFKTLLAGSRQIANGDFKHRIHVDSHDELAELAEALNLMTGNFVEIQQNLNEKVQQRTREVVRSEQLASVGFLAAGVAHEINNPLASIAWSAEALESRLHEILHPTDQSASSPQAAYDDQQIEVLRRYLRRIQDEAFRCKGITERLLDFSRLGESQRRQDTDVNQSVIDVIELVRHLGQYRNRTIDYAGKPHTLAFVSPTEFKQVALNLLTNSLDACDDGGTVTVKLESGEKQLTLTISDTGCGMTPEVMQHLFEPFFTRRRDGRGTGLGLSISYRIVEDHGGSLVPYSAGPNRGSMFTLTMPLKSTNEKTYERFQAAA